MAALAFVLFLVLARFFPKRTYGLSNPGHTAPLSLCGQPLSWQLRSAILIHEGIDDCGLKDTEATCERLLVQIVTFATDYLNGSLNTFSINKTILLVNTSTVSVYTS
jgi:hypothetical protein